MHEVERVDVVARRTEIMDVFGVLAVCILRMSIFVPLIESSNVVSCAKAMQKSPPRCKRPQYASRNFMFPACAYMMRDVRSLMSVRGRGRYPY